MTSLLTVRDEIDKIRNFVECAYMAYGSLDTDQAAALQALLDNVSDRLIAVSQVLADIRAEK